MKKQIVHPENLVKGSYYSVTYPSGDYLTVMRAMFVDIEIIEKKLCLVFQANQKNGAPVKIPYLKIDEIK